MSTNNNKREHPESREQNAFAGTGWIRHGLIWGSLMFALMVGFELLKGEEPLTLISTIRIFALWMVGGLIYGFIMKQFFNYRKK
ncbi:MAG: hypothetical protein AB8F74_13350 [Saprospiraceae bacterium]